MLFSSFHFWPGGGSALTYQSDDCGPAVFYQDVVFVVTLV